MAAFVIALLGAESTGKTQLAAALTQTLQQAGHDAALVTEYLRDFCDTHSRTPTRTEQAHIAAEQTRRIQSLAQRHAVVVADTTALMTAVYSEQVFDDRSLYSIALQAHQALDLTLLTALDIAWQADGLQREGPQVRGPVDALIRQALQRANLPFSVVSGQGQARLEQALRCVEHATGVRLSAHQENPDKLVRWRGQCERCGDAACERLCLPR
ncbi:MAG: AAA family ATPase [Burkholderiales bacterium]